MSPVEAKIRAVRKCVNLVELEKCCQTHIYLQTLVSIQPRTSPPKHCKKQLLILLIEAEPTSRRKPETMPCSATSFFQNSYPAPRDESVSRSVGASERVGWAERWGSGHRLLTIGQSGRAVPPQSSALEQPRRGAKRSRAKTHQTYLQLKLLHHMRSTSEFAA